MRTAARLIHFATTVLLMVLCSMPSAAAQETEQPAIEEQSSQLSFPREITGAAVLMNYYSFKN